MGKCISQSKEPIKRSTSTLDDLHIRRSNFRINYQVQEKIYEKLDTTIFLVTDKTTGEKRIVKSVQVFEKKLKPLLYETKTLQKLDHPHVIKFFEAYVEAEYLHIVREYCSGGELIERISKRINFSEHLASVYMQQITSALMYLHKNGIMHMDLKPENILLLNENENSPVKLINFTKVRKNNDSYLFRAPEGFYGDFVPESDIWSLGIIFYLMISGSLPFPDLESPTEHFLWLQTNEISYKSKIWNTISPEAKDLLQKMLQKDPKNRISSEEVYNHKWMEKFLSDQKPARISKKSLLRLSDYSRKSKLKRSLLSYLVTKVSLTDQIQKLISVFKAADKNADGELSIDEIIDCLKASGMEIEDPMFIVSAMNINDKGSVTYSEFVTAFVDWKKELNEAKLKKIFSEMDLNGDGFITPQEFSEVLNNKFTTDEMKTLLTEADENRDGVIDFREFCRIFE